MQFPWVAGYWRQRLSHQRCPCSAGAVPRNTCESVPGRMSPSPALRIRHCVKGTGVFFCLPSSEAHLVGFGCSTDLVSGFLNALVKGHCLLQTKAAWAWHSWRVPEEKKPGSSWNPTNCSLPPREWQGMAKLNLCCYSRLFFGLQRQFFFVFAANMFKFSLFWRQVVNASEVHTWHMFLFTCCPPFISCSRCSVYHFKCILIY